MPKNLSHDDFKRLMGLNKREPVTSALSSVLGAIKYPLDQYAFNQNIPLVGGQSAADLLDITGSQSLLEDISLRKSPPAADPRFLSLAGLLPLAKPAAVAAGKGAQYLGKMASKRYSPYTITQEFIPGTEDQIRNLRGLGFDKLLTAPEKYKYTKGILEKIPKIKGETSGSRWEGHGWWDGVSNPLHGIEIRGREQDVLTTMAGLGRGSSQAAEAATQKYIGGGLLGLKPNAVEIDLGGTATKKQLSEIMAKYGNDFGIAASPRGLKLVSFTDKSGLDSSEAKTVIEAGESAAKLLGGKVRPYAGRSIYKESASYEDAATKNRELAELIRNQTAEAAILEDSRVLMERTKQGLARSVAQEKLRKKPF